MIRERIQSELTSRKIPIRRCAIDNGILYPNFYNFLKGKRSLPIAKLEQVLKYLGIKL